MGPEYFPAFDGAETCEELQCTQPADSLPGLKFWIRNTAHPTNFFWSSTAIDKSHPKFVAQLEDGRLLVVEYKDVLTVEGIENRAIGELWKRMTGGKGLFIVVETLVGRRDMRDQAM